MDSAGFEPAASASRMQLSEPLDSFKVNADLSIEYLKYRLSRVKSKKSRYWIDKAHRELLSRTDGVISRETLMNFQNWYRQNYDYQAQCKFHDNTKNFLEWLYKRTGNSFFRDLQEVLERPQKPSKKINTILLREPDVENVLKAIWNYPVTPAIKLKYIAGILFAAYTGQRPDATIGKLTYREFKEALSLDPPLIHIPEEKDKEKFPHWVPLHPVVVQWIRPLLELHKGSEDELIFSYNTMRKLMDKINVKAIHTGRKIAYGHFRKFFEQMCNNVLMVHPGLRDYIMAHNTGSLDVQSYDGKLPSEIYEQYMAAWKDVDLVPEGVKLETLLKATKT